MSAVTSIANRKWIPIKVRRTVTPAERNKPGIRIKWEQRSCKIETVNSIESERRRTTKEVLKTARHDRKKPFPSTSFYPHQLSSIRSFGSVALASTTSSHNSLLVILSTQCHCFKNFIPFLTASWQHLLTIYYTSNHYSCLLLLFRISRYVRSLSQLSLRYTFNGIQSWLLCRRLRNLFAMGYFLW